MFKSCTCTVPLGDVERRKERGRERGRERGERGEEKEGRKVERGVKRVDNKCSHLLINGTRGHAWLLA